MDNKGYYKTLGVAEKATDDEIKKAFRKLSIKYHPDKQSGKSDKEKKEAEAKFKEVNEAYQVLSDKDKRAKYDSGASFDFGNAGGGYSGGFDFGDFNFDEFGFNPTTGFDFRSFFGGSSGRQQKPKAPEKGADIRMVIPVTLEEVYAGCTKKVKYQRNVRCANCHGAGGTNKHTCPDCNGTGIKRNRVHSMFGFTETTSTCPKCNGKGWVTDTKCPTCGGTGFKKEDTIIEVTFPKGILDGYALQFANKGNESSDPKGASGDFFAICKLVYDKDKYDVVNNVDIYENIDINYYDALLGCDLILEKPDYTKRKVTIPSCVPNGKVFKLANEGLPFPGSDKHGDYYIIISYKMPEKLMLEERKALEIIRYEYNKNNNQQQND